MNDPARSIMAGLPGAVSAFGLDGIECGCWTCVCYMKSQQVDECRFSLPFIVCDLCGNKRCPRASHHDNGCTGSNEVGQQGSRYS